MKRDDAYDQEFMHVLESSEESLKDMRQELADLTQEVNHQIEETEALLSELSSECQVHKVTFFLS